MKLYDWLNAQRPRWNMSDLSRETGIAVPIISKIIKGTGSINLDTALRIEHATGGKVTGWDISGNAEAICAGELHYRKKHKNRKNDDNQIKMQL